MDCVRRTGTWEGTFTVRRKDGRTFSAYVHNDIIENEHGQPIGLLGTSFQQQTTAATDPVRR